MRLLSLLLILCLGALPADAAGMKYRGFTAAKQQTGVAALPLTGPDGGQITIGAWKGQWLLLNLWATWCAPCVAELPALEKFAQSGALPNLAVAAVSMDTNKSGEQINAFLTKRKIGPFAGYRDTTHALEMALRSLGLPMTYLIDPNGKIMASYRGAADWMDPRVAQDLNRFMSAGTTSNTSPTKP